MIRGFGTGTKAVAVAALAGKPLGVLAAIGARGRLWTAAASTRRLARGSGDCTHLVDRLYLRAVFGHRGDSGRAGAGRTEARRLVHRRRRAAGDRGRRGAARRALRRAPGTANPRDAGGCGSTCRSPARSRARCARTRRSPARVARMSRRCRRNTRHLRAGSGLSASVVQRISERGARMEGATTGDTGSIWWRSNGASRDAPPERRCTNDADRPPVGQWGDVAPGPDVVDSGKRGLCRGCADRGAHRRAHLERAPRRDVGADASVTGDIVARQITVRGAVEGTLMATGTHRHHGRGARDRPSALRKVDAGRRRGVQRQGRAAASRRGAQGGAAPAHEATAARTAKSPA